MADTEMTNNNFEDTEMTNNNFEDETFEDENQSRYVARQRLIATNGSNEEVGNRLHLDMAIEEVMSESYVHPTVEMPLTSEFARTRNYQAQQSKVNANTNKTTQDQSVPTLRCFEGWFAKTWPQLELVINIHMTDKVIMTHIDNRIRGQKRSGSDFSHGTVKLWVSHFKTTLKKNGVDIGQLDFALTWDLIKWYGKTTSQRGKKNNAARGHKSLEGRVTMTSHKKLILAMWARDDNKSHPTGLRQLAMYEAMAVTFNRGCTARKMEWADLGFLLDEDHQYNKNDTIDILAVMDDASKTNDVSVYM